MASSVIGALRVNLGLDSAQFEKGARRVKSPLAAMRTQFLAAAGAAAALGAAISTMALKSAAEIDKTVKSARRLGSSVGGFRALEMAAGEAGVSLSTLTDSVQTMDREVARGSKNATSALSKLGIAAKDLEGLDADQKLALIADRVKALGLTSGQASALLQDLGIRNREMVLAVMAGGDVFRDARRDVEDYGLALSDVDAAAIEQANDRIGRLGLIAQYAGQRLAVELVPAIGRLAEAMTDSLRAGGLLRAMIDGLADNIERLGTYLAVAVTGFGVRYVGALVLARVATFSLSGALVFLKGALIRTGIGALVIAAGELVFWFGRLVKATGGWGNAFELLGEVVSGVWDGIKTSASAIVPALGAVWQDIRSGFISMLEDLALRWGNFLWALGAGVGKIPGFGGISQSLKDASDNAIDRVVELNAAASSASGAAIRLRGEAASLATQGFDKAREAAAKLAAAVSETTDETEDGATAAARLVDELGKVDSSAGGSAAEIPKVTDATNTLSGAMQSFKSSAQSAFAGLVTGAKSAKQALSDVLSSLASILANSAFESLFSGIGGGGKSTGFFGKLFGFANGTNYAPGGIARVNERGGEIINLPRGSQVIPHDISKRMADRSGGGSYAPVFNIDARGADVGAVQRIEQAMVKMQADFFSNSIQAFNVGKKRRLIT